jgi:hypothetical protein
MYSNFDGDLAGEGDSRSATVDIGTRRPYRIAPDEKKAPARVERGPFS